MQRGDDALGDHIYPTGCPMGRRYFCPRLFEKGFQSREDLKFSTKNRPPTINNKFRMSC